MGELAKPTDWDQLYPGRFLKAGELLGKQVTLRIKSVDLDELEGDKGKKVKGVLTFDQTNKQIALNRTNGVCLREMFGRSLSGWVGKRVTFYPAEWNGEPCIRVWGSPDIPQDMDIEVALPRRRTRMTMHAIRTNGKPAQQRQQRQAVEGSDGEPPADVPLAGQDSDEWGPGRE